MHRELVSIAALGALTLCIAGCPDENPKGNASGPKKAAPETTTTTTGAAADPSGKPKAGGGEAKFGTASIEGTVSFSGKAPEMKVPTKRKDTEVCKDTEVKYNAVIVNDGKLQDVFVRLPNGAAKGDWKAAKAAEIDQKDCMYIPRIQGQVAGGEINIKNSDGTLHNVHTYKGSESWFNQAQPKGEGPIKKELEDTKVIKFQCDVHPWMRGFVIVTDHPFFAVSGADGKFKIEKVPAGKYEVEAWHSQYGLKKGTVEVADGATGKVDFEYKGDEPEPDDNKEELKGLW
jgi:plastocyanin